jgi:uncharacterized protein YdhG (YjbR/CyaY superfamily)
MEGFEEYAAHVRSLVLAEEPDAEEGTSYGMLAWRLAGKPLIGLNEAKAHRAVYPFSTEVVDAVRDRLDGFTVTKGGVRCTPGRPVPDTVVEEMVRLRRTEIER